MAYSGQRNMDTSPIIQLLWQLSWRLCAINPGGISYNRGQYEHESPKSFHEANAFATETCLVRIYNF